MLRRAVWWKLTDVLEVIIASIRAMSLYQPTWRSVSQDGHSRSESRGFRFGVISYERTDRQKDLVLQ
jgi:hypothetical protein